MTRRGFWLGALAAAAVGLAACGGGGPSGGGGAGGDLSGAGATFPAPLYAKWAETYKAQSGQQLNYQAIGSGGGITQIKAGTVDFGASDKPLKPDALDKAGLYQFPTVIGGVTPIVNLPGVAAGQLTLTGPVLADIFSGAVTKWNAPAIAAVNPGVALPNLPISVVHRSDGSGTSFLFTTYLSMESPNWAAKIGANDAVNWPLGIGGKGNDGVAAFVKQTTGSIGYVEYAFARQNGLAFTLLKNGEGAAVTPNAASFAAAAAGADWSKAQGNYLLLLDQPGPQAWPIVGATFILVHRQSPDPAKTRAVLGFFDWAYKNGDASAAAMDYVPVPAAVKDRVRSQWAASLKGADGQAVYAATP